MLQRFKKGWKVKLKNYIKPIAIFLGIFVAVFIGSRTIVKGHDFTSTEIEYFTFYLGSPLHLFNKIIDDTTAAFPTHYNNILGAHTFKWFYQELYKFGLISTNIEATNFHTLVVDFMAEEMYTQCFRMHFMTLDILVCIYILPFYILFMTGYIIRNLNILPALQQKELH